MSLTDKINITLCILSFILAAISVVTVVCTLKQNNKMIRNSTRPYVVAMAQVTNFQNPAFYLVIKNYGNTGAIIKSLKSSIDLSQYSYAEGIKPFDNIANTFIAPGQTIICNLDCIKMSRQNLKCFDISVEYKDEIETFSEVYPINYEAYTKNIQTRASTKDKELKIISYTLQDLVEKQF